MDENLTRGYCQLRQQSPRVETRDSQRDSLPPYDRCSCIYLALVVCGAGFLLPYNSFITAVDYYQDKYPGSTIIFDISMTYICVAFAGVLLNNLVVEVLSLQTRITFGYILSFLVLLLVALCDVWFDVFSPSDSYKLTLVAVAAVAFGCTVQQSSFYGYTSMLPSRYTQAVMTGESAAGLIVSINRILTKALLDDVRINTIIFFIISIAIVWMCCVLFHVTMRTDFVRFYLSSCKNAGISEDQRGIVRAYQVPNPEEVSLVDIMDGTITKDSYGVLVIQSPATPPGDEIYRDDELRCVSNPRARTLAGSIAFAQEQQVKSQGRSFQQHISRWDAIKRGCKSRYKVATSVWPYMVSIGLAYLVTLCLFPGIESEVVSCRLHSWMPVLLISTFNLFDFIGKIIASIQFDWPQGYLVLCTVCRVIIVPLMMLCAAPRGEPVLTWEGWAMSFSLLLGITNGYFGSVPMIIAPRRVPDEQKELTGNIMTLSYSIGLTVGTAVAYLLNDWLGPHGSANWCEFHYNHTYNATILLQTLQDSIFGGSTFLT